MPNIITIKQKFHQVLVDMCTHEQAIKYGCIVAFLVEPVGISMTTNLALRVPFHVTFCFLRPYPAFAQMGFWGWEAQNRGAP
jgi:hypothetical protein